MRRHFWVYILGLLSCSWLLKNCDCVRLCNSVVPSIKFLNADSSTLAVVVLKPYIINGPSTDTSQTLVFTSDTAMHHRSYGYDTFPIPASGINVDNIYNYIVIVPATGKQWRITDIKMQPTKMSENNCTNGYTYKVNDTVYSVPPNNVSATGPVNIVLR
jgi:hypothetical protein